MPSIIIFTDLDGTLLDHESYSFEAATPALRALRARDIPVIFCSSKTRSEIEPIRAALGIHDPFVVENGGAIFIPAGSLSIPLPTHVRIDQYDVITLGSPYPELQRVLKESAQETGVSIRGCGQMSIKEFALLTGLSEKAAARAKDRAYDEPFVVQDGTPNLQGLLDRLVERGYRWTRGGRFHHVSGPHDKGDAVRSISKLYRQQHGSLVTVGLGDSLNDVPMLTAVDRPFLVQRPDGGYDPDVQLSRLERVEGKGPVGWNRAVLGLLAARGEKTPPP